MINIFTGEVNYRNMNTRFDYIPGAMDCYCPSYQITNAKDMAEYYSNNANYVKIDIFTYSPYVIQAFKQYGGNQVKFFLVEDDTNEGFKIKDVTSNLNDVFKIFSAPLKELVWDI